MNGNVPSENPASRLVRRARFAEERRRLSGLKDDLAACPHWMHGADLVAALDETLRDIDTDALFSDLKDLVAETGTMDDAQVRRIAAACILNTAAVDANRTAFADLTKILGIPGAAIGIVGHGINTFDGSDR